MWSDPAVTRFIGGAPNTKEEVWGRLLRYAGHWRLLGFGYFVAETRDAGAYVGEVGLGDYRRDVVPSFDGVPEIGWVLAPPAHGQGFATEAARAVLDWRDTALPPGPTMCMIDVEHAASSRVAAKLGFQATAPATRRGQPIVILRREHRGGFASASAR